MDIDQYKGKTLDDSLIEQLKKHLSEKDSRIEAAEEKARKAVKESIDGRKTLKAERDEAFAKLGVETAEELSALPDAKGQADKVAQLDAVNKRLARERDEALKASNELKGQISAARLEKTVAEAVAKHDFLDHSVVSQLVKSSIKQEGEDFLADAGGKLMPIGDFVAELAKSKPFLVKPTGSGGGSGFTGGSGGAGGANPWAPKTFNVTEQMRIVRENPATAAQLKAAAAQSAAQ